MPERTAPDAALRFVRDLRSLREDRGVSLDSLHQATRVPADVLESFEGNALYGNRMFNRVYLRSLVRAYSLHIGYDADRAVLALEEALAGQYDGSLLREPVVPEEVAGIEEPDWQEESPAYDDLDSTPGDPLSATLLLDETPAAHPVAEVEPTGTAEPTRMAEVVPQTRPDRAAPPPVVSWDAVSGSGRTPRVPVRGSTIPWGGIVGSVVLLALIVAGILWFLGRGDEATSVAAGEPVSQDTTSRQATAPPAPVMLPDTLVLRVTATNGPVSDIKIQRDDDVRRPYWIEVGQAQDFPFTTRATVENELQDATLMVQGVPYPTSRTDDQGRIVIARDTVARLLQQR